jgi:hypothetical protein
VVVALSNFSALRESKQKCATARKNIAGASALQNYKQLIIYLWCCGLTVVVEKKLKKNESEDDML